MPRGTTDLQGSLTQLLLTVPPIPLPALNSSPADHLLIFTIATMAYPPPRLGNMKSLRLWLPVHGGAGVGA